MALRSLSACLMGGNQASLQTYPRQVPDSHGTLALNRYTLSSGHLQAPATIPPCYSYILYIHVIAVLKRCVVLQSCPQLGCKSARNGMADVRKQKLDEL